MISFVSWMHLEVGHLRRVARLDEGLEAGLHERREAATEDRLLAEEIRLGLLAEGRLDDARAAAADRGGVRERDLLGVASW